MNLRRNALLALLAAAAPLSADVIVLKDGMRLEGRVEPIAGTKDRIAFTGGTGRMELPMSRIQDIEEEPDAADWTRIGNAFLAQKNNTAAIRHFQQALEADPSHAEAQAGLKAAQDAIDAIQKERDREQQAKLGAALEQVPELVKNENFTEAQAIIQRVLDGKGTEEQRLAAQRAMRDLYLAWGFSRYDRLDYKGAEEKYTRVLEMDPINEEARERLLVIWRNDPAKKPEVLKAYQAKLAAEPNNLEFNRTVGDMLYEAQRWQESLAPLSKVAAAPRYAGQGYDKRLLNAYKQAIQVLGDSNKRPEAIAAYQEMLTKFPDEDTTGLVVLRYEDAKSRLADNDWNGKAQLARKLYDDGMTSLAQREAMMILKSDSKNEVADSILRQEATAALARIEEQFREGNYVVAREMATRFTTEYTRHGDLLTKAAELYNKSDIEAKRVQKANAEQAREIATRGIDYYNQALRFIELMGDRNRRSNVTAISNKQEAIKYCRRAIDHMETALKIDPSLGPSTSMDVTARLRDAKGTLASLTGSARNTGNLRNPEYIDTRNY